MSRRTTPSFLEAMILLYRNLNAVLWQIPIRIVCVCAEMKIFPKSRDWLIIESCDGNA